MQALLQGAHRLLGSKGRGSCQRGNPEEALCQQSLVCNVRQRPAGGEQAVHLAITAVQG